MGMNAGIIINVSIPLTLFPQRLDHLKRVVDAVIPQMNSGDGLVFVDDQSCKEVRDYLDELMPESASVTRVIHRDLASFPELSEDGRPWRLASSRNLGVKTLGEYAFYVFLDADCAPAEGWLEVYRAYFTPSADRFVLPRLLFGQTRHQGLTRPEGTYSDPRLCGRDPGDAAGRLVALFERGGGGNMAISHYAWEQTGGFNEEFDGGFGYEETELACRVYERGGEVLYVPKAEVLHLYHSRTKTHFHNMDRNRRLFMAETGLSAFAR